MAMNLNCMLYLQARGHLSAEKNRILDIGPQNVYFATPDQVRSFVQTQGAALDQEALNREIERVVYFSTPRPEERTTLFSEITDLTNIEYNSFDVCAALKTEILDLNYDDLPGKHRENYDVVMNFGTTEHVFNQLNSFEIMHNATKVGGVIYCVLPASGYLDHGYYCYTPVFFRDMASANDYEILDMFFCLAGLNELDKLDIDLRTDKQLMKARSAQLAEGDKRIPNFNVHAVLRKTKSAPFALSLEIATAHAPLNAGIAERYGSAARGAASPRPDVSDAETVMRVQRDSAWTERDEALAQLKRSTAEREAMLRERDAAWTERDAVRAENAELRQSTSWRLTGPLRSAAELLRGNRRKAG
jgi:hypothetical protein